MKKVIFTVLISTLLFACSGKVYNSALKQVELGMTKGQVIGLMGDEYTTTGQRESWGKTYESLQYTDRYKFHWFFDFENNRLIKWYKEEGE